MLERSFAGRNHEPSGRTILKEVAKMRLIVFCCVGLVLSSLAGCTTIVTQLKDRRDDLAIHRTNRSLARMAWSDVEGCYDDLPCREDFEKGFKRGYSDRASGLNGCPPALPPRRYWRAKLMGHEAMGRANAWFDGYRHGVVIAEQDGNADLARVPSSVPLAPHCLNETYSASTSHATESIPREIFDIPTETAPEPSRAEERSFQTTTPLPALPGSPIRPYDEAVPGEELPEIPPAPAPDTFEALPPTDPNASPPPALPPNDDKGEEIPGTAAL